jgi:undecaprenyl-diphosphatase
MFEFFHTISLYLETFLDAISGNFWLTFWFIFGVAIGEAVFILGLFVPSTPVLLMAGGIIAEGRLPFWEVYFAAVIGAIIGDAISYTIGHFLKDKIKTMWPFRNHVDLITRGEVFFAKHGGKAVFIGRFIPGVKAVIPGVAGIMGMRYGHFTVIIVVGALVLTVLFLGLHYHRRILLFFAPWMGGLGRSIRARWGNSDAVH